LARLRFFHYTKFGFNLGTISVLHLEDQGTGKHA